MVSYLSTLPSAEIRARSVRLCKSRICNRDWLVVQAVRVLRKDAGSDASVTVSKADVDFAALSILDRQAFFQQVLFHDRNEALERISDVKE